jgi:hypothetical protein
MKSLRNSTLFLIIAIMLSCSKEERTPYSITKALVGLEIKKDVSVIEYKDQWGSMTGDGVSFIIFKVQPNQLAEIKDSCKTKAFKALPIKESLPDNFINHYVSPSDTIGYYWLDIDKNDNRNYCIVVLSEVSNKLIVYNVIN